MHSSTNSDRLKFCSALSAALTASVIVSQEIKSAIKEKMSRIRRAVFKNTVPFDQSLFQSSYILETLEGNPAPRVLRKWFIHFFGWWNFLLLRTPTCSALKKEQFNTQHWKKNNWLFTSVGRAYLSHMLSRLLRDKSSHSLSLHHQHGVPGGDYLTNIWV